MNKSNINTLKVINIMRLFYANLCSVRLNSFETIEILIENS